MASILSDNVYDIPALHEVRKDNAVLPDQSSIQIDRILFCTGYHYSFPFLSESIGLSVANQRVWPLYKHVVHMKYDTLFFIGVPRIYVPFPQMNGEVQFALSKLNSKWSLPSKEKMDFDVNSDLKIRSDIGWSLRHTHVMRQFQWDYNRQLSKIGGFDPIPRNVQLLYDYNMARRDVILCDFRRLNYKLTADGFQVNEISKK